MDGCKSILYGDCRNLALSLHSGQTGGFLWTGKQAMLRLRRRNRETHIGVLYTPRRRYDRLRHGRTDLSPSFRRCHPCDTSVWRAWCNSLREESQLADDRRLPAGPFLVWPHVHWHLGFPLPRSRLWRHLDSGSRAGRPSHQTRSNRRRFTPRQLCRRGRRRACRIYGPQGCRGCYAKQDRVCQGAARRAAFSRSSSRPGGRLKIRRHLSVCCPHIPILL